MARDNLDRGDQQDRHTGLTIPKEFQKLSMRRSDKVWIPVDIQTGGLAVLPYYTESKIPSDCNMHHALCTTKKEKTLPITVVRHHQLSE